MELTRIKRKVDEAWEEKEGIFTRKGEEFCLPEKSRSWSGRWIWAPEDHYPEHQICACTAFAPAKGRFAVFLFQKKWTEEVRPQKGTLYITADASYKVYINGRTAGYGSAQPGGDYGNMECVRDKYYEQYDVSGFLAKGENVITVRVCLGAVVQSEISCGHGGLIADLILTDGEKEKVVATDGSWSCGQDRAYSASDQWNGALAAKDDDYGYEERDFKRAEVVKDQGQFPRLLSAQIPVLSYVEKYPVRILNPFEQEGKKRVTWNEDISRIVIRKGAPVTFWLDFGAVYAGIPHMEMSGGEACKIVWHMQEFPGKVERTGTTETYFLGKGVNSGESLRLHSVHYIQVVISNFTEDVIMDNPGIHVSLYPAEMKGSFKCSEPIYDRIYLLGCRTLQICRQTYHMDSPVHQEPLGCMGDYMIESLMNYYTFGDAFLTRFDIRKIAAYLITHDYEMFHPSYCLLYIQMIYDYILYTGDEEILDETLQAVTGTLEKYLSYLGEDMLIEKAPDYMFMDWIAEGEYNRHHPPKCMGQGYLTAMLAGALDNGIRILRLTEGNGTAIRRYRKYRERIVRAVNELLWKEEKGLFVDGLYDAGAVSRSRWLPADINVEFYSQHMNALAVLYDILPKERQKELMVQVIENNALSQAQPYFMHFIFEALAKTGLFEKYGLGQIARWKDLLEENPSGLKEVWSGFDCDYSHAWGGTPTYQLPAKILGVTPAVPGFGEIFFRPCLPGELSYAYGTIPTPHGIIEVSLSRRDGEVEEEIHVPEGVKVIRG